MDRISGHGTWMTEAMLLEVHMSRNGVPVDGLHVRKNGSSGKSSLQEGRRVMNEIGNTKTVASSRALGRVHGVQDRRRGRTCSPLGPGCKTDANPWTLSVLAFCGLRSWCCRCFASPGAGAEVWHSFVVDRE